MPRRQGRPRRQGHQLPAAARRRRSGRAGRRLRRAGRRRGLLPRHHAPRRKAARRSSTSSRAPPIRCSRRSPSAAACARSTMPSACSLAGADKIAVNTAAIRTPQLVADIAARFGNQAIVVAVDAEARRPTRLGGLQPRRPHARGPRRARAGAGACADLGAGELLVDQHGSRRHRQGLRPRADPRDRDARRPMPVIASGGVGKLARPRRWPRGRRRRGARRLDLPLRPAHDRRGQGVSLPRSRRSPVRS